MQPVCGMAVRNLVTQNIPFSIQSHSDRSRLETCFQLSHPSQEIMSQQCLPLVQYQNDEMLSMDDSSSSMLREELVMPLSDDDLRALMDEADYSLKRAQELQRAALLHLYHSNATPPQQQQPSSSSVPIVSPTTTRTILNLHDGSLSTDESSTTTTALGEGSLFRLATALSYHKESTVHMTRFQRLQAQIDNGRESRSHHHRWSPGSASDNASILQGRTN
jgi:hypothetical protein